MEEGWGRQLQRAVEEELAGGGEQQIGSAHNLRDAHGRVVRHDRELIGRNIVVAPDDEVAEVASSDECLWAEVAVDEGDGLAVGDA